MMLDKYITWFKAHERLVIVLACLLVTVHFYSKGIDYFTRRDQLQAQQASQKLAVDTATNLALTSQLNDLKKQFADEVAQLQKQIQTRNQVTEKQKEQDASMTEVELAQRWAGLINVRTEEVQASPVQGTLQVSDNAAHVTVARLEDLPTCQANLIDTEKQLADANTLNTKNAGVIASDATVLASEKKLHEDDVKTLKAANKGKWLNGFKWGVITGFLGSLFVHKP